MCSTTKYSIPLLFEQLPSACLCNLSISYLANGGFFFFFLQRLLPFWREEFWWIYIQELKYFGICQSLSSVKVKIKQDHISINHIASRFRGATYDFISLRHASMRTSYIIFPINTLYIQFQFKIIISLYVVNKCPHLLRFTHIKLSIKECLKWWKGELCQNNLDSSSLLIHTIDEHKLNLTFNMPNSSIL